MRVSVLATVMLVATLGAAQAEIACNSEIEKTKSDWKAISLQPASKPGVVSKGLNGHAHIQSAVDSMRFHLSEATTLCKLGNDHEALLHIDIVRAFLNLPEIQHPTDHRYLFNRG